MGFKKKVDTDAIKTRKVGLEEQGRDDMERERNAKKAKLLNRPKLIRKDRRADDLNEEGIGFVHEPQ